MPLNTFDLYIIFEFVIFNLNVNLIIIFYLKVCRKMKGRGATQPKQPAKGNKFNAAAYTKPGVSEAEVN